MVKHGGFVLVPRTYTPRYAECMHGIAILCGSLTLGLAAPHDDCPTTYPGTLELEYSGTLGG